MLHQRNVLWANHGNFLTKQLRNASMKRPKLPNGFLEGKNDTSQSAQEKQCKLCEKPLRNIKEQFFLNLDPELIAENKKFWESAKSLFSHKTTVKEKINLTENWYNLSTDTDIVETFKQKQTALAILFKISILQNKISY